MVTYRNVCVCVLTLSPEKTHLVPISWLHYHSSLKGTRFSWRSGWLWDLGRKCTRYAWDILAFQKLRNCLKRTNEKFHIDGAMSQEKQESTEIAPEGKVGTIWATQKISSVGL